MYIRALVDLYDRLSLDPQSGVSPFGFERRCVPFVIVLDADGTPVDLECTYESRMNAFTKKQELIARQFLVPNEAKRSGNINPNLLWDFPPYIIGELFGERDRGQHAAFVVRHQRLKIDDAGVVAVQKFLEIQDKIGALKKFPAWKRLMDAGCVVMSFRLSGDKCLVTERPRVIDAVSTALPGDGSSVRSGICMVTGEYGPIARLHPPIRGIKPPASSKGTSQNVPSLICFNQVAFTSHGRLQGDNAPIGVKTSKKYANALEHLLSRGSRQKLYIGDTTVVFWAAERCSLEKNLLDIFGDSPADDPGRNARAVSSLYGSVHSGALADDPDPDHTMFYVLGMSLNRTRIRIDFFLSQTVAEMSRHIRQHLDDMNIVRRPEESEAVPLSKILLAVTPRKGDKKLPPGIKSDVLTAALTGSQYPAILYNEVLQRISSEQSMKGSSGNLLENVTRFRAAIVKAFLNRTNRLRPSAESIVNVPRQNSTTTVQEVNVGLDKNNCNIGYLLGRTMAVLEHLQYMAIRDVRCGIRSTHYDALSTTPATAYGYVMGMKNHWMNKLGGLASHFDRIFSEIADKLPPTVPPILSQADRGAFAVGYYHQRRSLFDEIRERKEIKSRKIAMDQQNKTQNNDRGDGCGDDMNVPDAAGTEEPASDSTDA